jgi:hypothetical protein
MPNPSLLTPPPGLAAAPAATAAVTVQRVLLTAAPFAAHAAVETWATHSQWPAAWVATAARPRSGAALFALRVTLAERTTVRLHVTAHEGYLLTINDQPLGRGPERGSSERWCFESYDVTLAAGEHRLLAQVWCAGEHASHSAMSEGLGFLLAVEGEAGATWSTGRAPWTVRPCEAYTFASDVLTFAAAPAVTTQAAALAVADEDDREWPAATVLGNGQIGHPPGCLHIARLLVPAALPPQRHERVTGLVVRWVGPQPADTAARLHLRDDIPEAHAAWARLLAGGGPCVVPAGRSVAVLLDSCDYLCAYPDLRVLGGAGATVRLAWSEALTTEPATGWKAMAKGHRDEIDGKCFTCFGADSLQCDGQARTLPPLYWRAGRYVLLTVTTAAEPLTITALGFDRTGYALPQEAELAGNAAWETLVPLLVRTLRSCAHDTYMDCPYFERLQYVGDARLEALVTYVLCRDDRLPRKAIEEFAASRLAEGLVQARFPARHRQVIPPFALFWIGMVHDFATWRDDPAFVRKQLPGVRAVLDGMLARCGDDHILCGGPGWNFLDWTGWVMGDPPGAVDGNASHNWQLVGALIQAAELEEAFGDEDLARRWRRLAARLTQVIETVFWRAERGLYAEDRGATCFTEHAQCLAVLSGALSPEKRAQVGAALIARPNLVPATLYFSHYLFAAYTALGRADRLQVRMAEWFGLAARGLLTAPEKPEPCRSDCHAWSAHPFFHAFAGLLGIQPQGFGFRRVRIAPQLGGLPALRGRLPHPTGGWISVDAGATGCRVSLPPGVVGTLATPQGDVPLAAGVAAG